MSLSTSWHGGKRTATLKKSFIVIATCHMYDNFFLKKSLSWGCGFQSSPVPLALPWNSMLQNTLNIYSFFFWLKKTAKATGWILFHPTKPVLSHLLLLPPQPGFMAASTVRCKSLTCPRHTATPTYKCAKDNTSGVLSTITPGALAPNHQIEYAMSKLDLNPARPCYSLMPSLWAIQLASLEVLVSCTCMCTCMPRNAKGTGLDSNRRPNKPLTTQGSVLLPLSHGGAFLSLFAPEEACLKHFYWSMHPFNIWTLNQTGHWAPALAFKGQGASTCCLCVYKLVECRFSFIHTKLDFCVLLVLYEFQNGMHCYSFKWLAAMYI